MIMQFLSAWGIFVTAWTSALRYSADPGPNVAIASHAILESAE
jgi:hypothetical protein